MPRSGWLAAGAATGALTASLPLGASLILVAAVVGAGWLLTGHRRASRGHCVALALGISAVVLRLVIGSDHRRLIPASIVAGAAFMVLADLAARTAVSPEEIPVGAVTAVLGGPFFLYLLRRQRRISRA